jgi:hypothetical protein
MPKRTNNSPGTSPKSGTPAKTARVEKKPKNTPTQKSKVVKIDIVSKNGNKINEDLPVKTLLEIWNFLDSDSEPEGCSSHRRPGGAIRAAFCLKTPVCLGELYPEPEFTFERTSPLQTDAFLCKIVGLDDVRPPKAGENVTLSITRTHFAVPLEVIEEWISKFGTIVTKPR